MEKEKNIFRDTLNLPVTPFSIRAHAEVKEAEIVDRWNTGQLCAAAQMKNATTGQRFVLHDGPPYANGSIHMGTTLNKVLKDMVVKSKRMAGYHAPFIPGWDCHGLPIELKVTEKIPLPENPQDTQRSAFKKECRAFAQRWIETQKAEFTQLGVLADWENRYYTMSYQYQAAIIRAFAQFVDGNYIERKGKTVPWCFSCKTVLSQAEIEHYERKDPSLYVSFPLVETSRPACLQALHTLYPEITTYSVIIWTTTPWTLPLNRAVIAHPDAPYVVVRATDTEAFILARDMVAPLSALTSVSHPILAQFSGKELTGMFVHHPFDTARHVPLLFDESVALDQGTAFVHSAPGCGPEDYLIGIRNGLEIYSPLSPDGRYTAGIVPAQLEGMSILDAQGWVITQLLERKKLVHKASLKHAYPHCWRCKRGLMFRATDQWFCSLQQGDLVTSTIDQLSHISFIPAWGKNRLAASISHRTEWCISRQRQWGTPLIALFCTVCEHPFLNSTFIKKIADGVADHGIEYWDTVDLATVQAHVICTQCGNDDRSRFKKERDILDVWFDSGVSHYAVLALHGNGLLPADMYLEGSDQHRGWFQSSLLTSMVLNKVAPMKTIFTHGYVVDDKGHKMSKSLGNVIAPADVIKDYSVDILRLWVASTDVEKDCVISKKLLDNVAEVYRKIRNTCRFILANLYDFSQEKESLPYDQLLMIDRYALMQRDQIATTVKDAYQRYDFTTVYTTLGTYCSVNLSAFYLDIIKDRLYVETPDGRARRSAQTVLWSLLDTITRLMAPVLSFLAEEVADHYQAPGRESIHLQLFAPHSSSLALHDTVQSYADVWSMLHEMRSAVLKAIEQQRAQGVIKHSLEARVTLYVDASAPFKKQFEAFKQLLAADEYTSSSLQVDHSNPETRTTCRFFNEWFIVSQSVMRDAIPDLKECEQTSLPWLMVRVERAHGVKCPRCWQWDVTERADELCARCVNVLGK